MKLDRRKATTDAASPDEETGSASPATIEERVGAIDWTQVHAELDAQGWAIAPKLLSDAEADFVSGLYGREQGFRSHIVMSRHGFGRGEYKYFSYPLPDLIQSVRTAAYPYLAPIANRWHERMGKEARFPADHAAFLERCHRAGQLRPTPLLLSYASGDYNCLHRDLYGEQVFPIQIAILLDQPGVDFAGGEFVMTEQRPRMQTRAMVLPLDKGDAVLFAVHSRPMQGGRGDYQVKLSHGVSKIHKGRRHTVGIIFHDAT
ncbi:MAG: 2OG-Fe(II) oxygenase [Ancalomicrobiaceae bacterium]|nr:2OG-Fe(II) oxygenase [Ancalomicrobiaceae bacterium]